MYPIFVSVHPLAALCSDPCLQPHTFSCFHICPSPAPACCWWAGRRQGASQGSPCLPARQEIASSLSAARSNAAKLVLMGRLLPKFLLGRYSVLCDKDGESKLIISRCFRVWFTWVGEREEGENNGSVLLKQAVSKNQSTGSKLLSLLESDQDWREWALKTQARAAVENLAPYVFWSDIGFRDLENKSCWQVGAVASLSKYPE